MTIARGAFFAGGTSDHAWRSEIVPLIRVAEAGGAHYGQVRNAITRLVRAQGHVLGCIVTKYNRRKSGYAATGNYYRYDYRAKE